ncbi:MAG: sigma-70 family RNA polymerase sigma factor [Actinomycetota bacterium]|nr:sigma-70 family RNA polymerase sigma factor [Actinomycetota bacterium]
MTRPPADTELQHQPAAEPAVTLDAESTAWLSALHAQGPQREEAVRALHELLLRAARFEVSRRRGSLGHLAYGDLEDLAVQAADDACVSVLARLDTFRGLSRFTTWAYKFAVYETSTKARRRGWQGREIPLEPEAWALLPDQDSGPAGSVEHRELLEAVQHGINAVLTAHQRRVLVALTISGVPIDVLAERLGTTRGALYKTLHDARRRLRTSLHEQGLVATTAPAGKDS